MTTGDYRWLSFCCEKNAQPGNKVENSWKTCPICLPSLCKSIAQNHRLKVFCVGICPVIDSQSKRFKSNAINCCNYPSIAPRGIEPYKKIQHFSAKHSQFTVKSHQRKKHTIFNTLRRQQSVVCITTFVFLNFYDFNDFRNHRRP